VLPDVDNGCMSYLCVSKCGRDQETGFANNMNKQEADVSEQESRYQLGWRFHIRGEKILNPLAKAGGRPSDYLGARRQHFPSIQQAVQEYHHSKDSMEPPSSSSFGVLRKVLQSLQRAEMSVPLAFVVRVPQHKFLR
jgi:hypothetical protein